MEAKKGKRHAFHLTGGNFVLASLSNLDPRTNWHSLEWRRGRVLGHVSAEMPEMVGVLRQEKRQGRRGNATARGYSIGRTMNARRERTGDERCRSSRIGGYAYRNLREE